MENFEIYSNNHDLYTKMLSDIEQALDFVYLETYIFDNGRVGKKFKEMLTQKAREGVKIKLLLDDIGSPVKRKHFKELEKYGGKLKFFRELKLTFDIISSNNYRDHRKILIIDNKISYIGSANISTKSIDWRDLSIRFDGEISKLLTQAFNENYLIADKHSHRKKIHTIPLRYKDFEIVRDVPSVRIKQIRKREIALINKAKKKIYIETPYFIPDRKLRKRLKIAVRRGVKVEIAIPEKSDVMIVNILSKKYWGRLHRAGIKIKHYRPNTLHSKMMIIDNTDFTLGSANLDNRSSIFQYEINLFGKNKQILSQLQKHAKSTIVASSNFDYERWKKRSLLQIALERLLTPFKYLL